MADIKISQLTAKGTALAATDLVEIAEDHGAGGYVTKSVTGANILDSKQPTLVSGTNIKTINSNTILGSGDLVVGGGVPILTKPISGRTYSIRTDSTTAGTAGTPLANTIYLSPFIPSNSITISSLQIFIYGSAVGALMRILVYSDSNGVPSSKLIESTSLDCSTTGTKIFTTSFTFTAGTTYWLGVYTNNASLSMATISLANSIPISTNAFSSAYPNLISSATFASAPTTLGTATLNITNMFVINLTAV